MHVFGRKPEYLESTQAGHTEGRQPGLTQDLHAELSQRALLFSVTIPKHFLIFI